ncbi:Eri1 [Symbiodinium microadriaticum]|nr:Eri1 [Symbiodinium microadriaticum]
MAMDFVVDLCGDEELTEEVPEEWVRRVQEVCPRAPREAVVGSLRETRDESRTINQLLDGLQPVPTKRPRLETAGLGHGGHASTSVPGAKTTEEAPAGKALPGWGPLRAPTARDMKIRRGPGSPLQPPSFEYLVVLDFEWTADNRKAVKPISEITQFPSVLVRLAGRKTAIVDEFNAYVRPTLNPILPQFSIDLTGITQDMVDRSAPLEEVLPQYMEWLKSHGLVSDDGRRQGFSEFGVEQFLSFCSCASALSVC